MTTKVLFKSRIEAVIASSIILVGVIAFVANVAADSVSTSVTVSNATPAVSAVTFNNGTAITLTENTTKTVYATSTVTDSNGCPTIVGVSADFYRSGITATGCDTAGEADANHCYPVVSCTVVSGSCTGPADTAADYVCSVNLDYYTDPTDTGTYSAQNWVATISAGDGVATSTGSGTTEVNTLKALDVTASMNYGTLAAGSNTDTANSTTTVTNTGNSTMDPLVSGTDMTSGPNTITVGNQKYSLTSFDYDLAGTALSGTPTAASLNLAQRTAGVVTGNVLWGINVPNGTISGSYTGTNTFTAN
jgi:hypothetical protein